MKKLSILLIVGGFIILGLILGYLMWPRGVDNLPADNSGNGGETPTEIDTSEWKTYRNEEYGFEFKYPNYFVIDERGVIRFSSHEFQYQISITPVEDIDMTGPGKPTYPVAYKSQFENNNGIEGEQDYVCLNNDGLGISYSFFTQTFQGINLSINLNYFDSDWQNEDWRKYNGIVYRDDFTPICKETVEIIRTEQIRDGEVLKNFDIINKIIESLKNI